MKHYTETAWSGKDLAGFTNGMLEVIQFSHIAESSGKKVDFWSCQCKCGKELIVSGNSIRRRKRKSCGCIKRESRKKLEGKKIGRWSVLKYEGNKKYTCQCECGNIKSVDNQSLRRGKSLSCGCLQIETVKSLCKKRIKHGMSKSKAYHTWCSIRDRCENSNNGSYERYGGRGISVCKRWTQSFELFMEDMGIPPTAKHTIDRIDNNGDYEPSNCRWATMEEQQNNRSNNRVITHEGESKTLAEWCKHSGMRYSLIQWRLDAGWEFKKAIETPPRSG